MFESFTAYRMSSPTHSTPARILVADDQPDVLEALRWLLSGEGYEPQFVNSTDGVIERLGAEKFDLLLMDLNYSRDTTSGREGLELIPRVRVQDPSMPIVVMTGWGSIDTAVEAMRRGLSPKDAGVEALKRIRANTVEARLLNSKGNPNFNIRFFVLNKRGEYAGLAMYHAGETKYAVCTENGAQAMELEPLLPGAPED